MNVVGKFLKIYSALGPVTGKENWPSKLKTKASNL